MWARCGITGNGGDWRKINHTELYLKALKCKLLKTSVRSIQSVPLGLFRHTGYECKNATIINSGRFLMFQVTQVYSDTLISKIEVTTYFSEKEVGREINAFFSFHSFSNHQC